MTPLSPSSPIQASFATFFAARDREKTAVYGGISLLGWSMLAVGVVVGVTGLLMWGSVPIDSPLFVPGNVVACVGATLLSTGICLFSSVPTDELDLDTFLDKRPRLRLAAQIGFGAIAFLVGVMETTFFPYFTAVPIIPVGLWLLQHGSPLEAAVPSLRSPISIKVSSFTTLLFAHMASVYLVLGVRPEMYALNLAVPGLWSDWAAMLNRSRSVSRPLFVVAALIFAAGGAMCAYTWMRLAAQAAAGRTRNGWRTTVFYTTLYCWMLSFGLAELLINVVAVFVTDIIFSASVLPTIAICAVVLIPPLLSVVIGADRSFSLVARYFEYDIRRLQKDGALMAELASSSQVLDTVSNCRWVYRQKASTVLGTSADSNAVRRTFWVKGVMQGSALGAAATDDVTVRVSMRDDTNTLWESFYTGTVLQTRATAGSGGAAATDVPRFTAAQFADWRTTTFLESDIVEVDNAAQEVVVRTAHSSAASKRAELLAWATSNFRVFEWRNFSDELLLKSPRLLSSNAEKSELFSLSSHREITHNSQKVDYFLSHSWDDDAQVKCRVLRSFMAGRPAGTLWLDKVCIDQRNPGNALAVLPINIGACSKMLILMSRTYLRRLWCVWELFSLFTFCYKELAIERIVVLSLEDGSGGGASFNLATEMRNFDIDNAHCFDPNEEYKLRQIIHDIGVDRLKTSLETLADSLSTSRAQGRGK